MPLIIVTGRPCTGKTTFASRLKDYLLASGKENVILVNEESLNLSKSESYQSATKEKVLRGAIKSAADHALTSSTYVIVDSLNYIKAANEDMSAMWNRERILKGDDGYEETVFADLRLRYEAPIESNRWDAPLFKVNSLPPGDNECNKVTEELTSKIVTSPSTAPAVKAKSSWKPKKSLQKPTDSETPVVPTVAEEVQQDKGPKGLWFSGSMSGVTDDLSAFQSAEEVLVAIGAYFSTAQAPTPNSSTVIAQHAQADLLYELDRTSQQITQVLVTHQADNVEGTPVRLVEYDRMLTMTRFSSMAELQRLRRQWVKINAQHPPSSTQAIGASFIDFLAVHL
eukprot:gene34083-41254_t